jgi:hypothetical protein
LQAEKADDPVGAGEVVLGFAGDGLRSPPGICFTYYPLVRGLDNAALFEKGVLDEAHAYLTWYSPYQTQDLLPDKGGFLLSLVKAGAGYIYYNETPASRDPGTPRTLGVAVATFVRRAGLYVYNPRVGVGMFTMTADLVSSKTFRLKNGKEFNFRDLIPYGMTCTEAGEANAEAGTCVANGRGW